MKRLKQVLLAATMATFLIGGSIGFAKAATKEDISYLIKETEKTECIREYDDGVRRKALSDREKVGDEEKNIYFGINYREFQNETRVEDVLIIIDYIKHKGSNLDIKHLAIRDGYGNPDGNPDAIEENRVFETEEFFEVNDNGVKEIIIMRSIDDSFPLITYLEGSQEEERINKIFDYAVEIFKLKTKETLTPTEKIKYQSLKKDIETLVLKSKHLQKSREELEQLYYGKN